MSEFPHFEDDQMEYLLYECDMSILFEIGSTAEYLEYPKSETINYTPMRYELNGYVSDYSDVFIEKLNDIFCYSIYENCDDYKVKLKLDYIKHNTSVAFPSVLLLKDKIENIPYEITSKNNPEIVKGVLSVQNSDV